MLKTAKIFLLITLTVFSPIFFSCKKKNVQTQNDNSKTSPNIIFIIADDMGWDAFGDYPGINGSKANTPTLDSLAKNGITFNNYWVNPECSPTRAAMLTGKYGFRTGVGSAGGILQNNETLIQKYIMDKTNNAYSSAVIGKWHVSSGNNLTSPESFGIPYYSGFLVGAVPSYYNWTQTTNGIQQTVTTYTTTQFINQSVSWIKQQQKPFFLWLALNAPHTPFHRPPLNLISDKTLVDNQAVINSNPLSYYLSSIEAMDNEIGRLIASLTEEQTKNTIFIFMGDNGTPSRVAQKPFGRNKAKSSLFQGGINTPLIVSGYNVIRKNVIENAMVQATDIFATLADITTISSINAEDGKSIYPLFKDANAIKRDFAYSEFFGSPESSNNGYAVRNKAYKFIHLESGKEFLFKISIDPFEFENLLDRALTSEAQNNLRDLKLIKAKL